MNAKQKTTSAATNGKRPNGVPEWSANLGVEYKASNDFSVLMRGNYVGSSYVRDEKYSVPSYFTLDAGVNYKTSLNSTPVTLRAMCYNVTNKSIGHLAAIHCTLVVREPLCSPLNLISN